jgi:hypothetical protein
VRVRRIVRDVLRARDRRIAVDEHAVRMVLPVPTGAARRTAVGRSDWGSLKVTLLAHEDGTTGMAPWAMTDASVHAMATRPITRHRFARKLQVVTQRFTLPPVIEP